MIPEAEVYCPKTGELYLLLNSSLYYHAKNSEYFVFPFQEGAVGSLKTTDKSTVEEIVENSITEFRDGKMYVGKGVRKDGQRIKSLSWKL